MTINDKAGQANILLYRLDQISQSLKKTGKAQALIGFGSIAELDRLDAYSDLDFLVVAKQGCKADLIENIDWLTGIAPVAYYYMHTDDGYKLFYEDGIFCDFGILQADEVRQIPHAHGRIIWCEQDFDSSLCLPTYKARDRAADVHKEVGEALSSLYVGLCRYARGEKLSAARCIQQLAVDHILACSEHVTSPAADADDRDPFEYDRRYEQRYSDLARSLPAMIQGYERSPESAAAIIEFMDKYFDVNPFMKRTIMQLADECKGRRTAHKIR